MPSGTPRTTSSFVQEAKKKHKSLYTYKKVKYIDSWTKVSITCKVHGEFEQQPQAHLRGQGCPKCTKGPQVSFQDFIKKAGEIHNSLYKYQGKTYTNMRGKIKIHCHIHGYFEQQPVVHLRGHGCPKCGNIKSASARYKTSEVEIRGRSFLLQGFEVEALEHLLTQEKFKITEIKNRESVPVITYELNGRKRLYYPDFFIKRDNRLVEVKSLYTMGLGKSSATDRLLDELKAKRLGCKQQGYKFQLLVFARRKGGLIKLPRNWWCMTKAEIIAHL